MGVPGRRARRRVTGEHETVTAAPHSGPHTAPAPAAPATPMKAQPVARTSQKRIVFVALVVVALGALATGAVVIYGSAQSHSGAAQHAP